MQVPENQSVALLHLGGLGDLVLSSELVFSLKSACPHTTVTLVCRQECASVVELFPVKPDVVIGLDLNPHLVDRPSEELRRSLQQIIGLFAGFRPDLLVECSLRPTWLSFFLNALLKPAKSFCCEMGSRPAALLPIVLEWFGLSDLALPNLGLPDDLPEADRYGLLIGALAVPRVRSFPWQPPVAMQARASDWLEANGLAGTGFVACFPGGSPGSEIKRWPEQNFIQALDRIRARGLEILLLGSAEERGYLSRISHVLERGPVPVFAESKWIQLSATLLSRAAGYLGNDTGPAHLAQAYGIPGVAIFGGGGQWPRYSAWAPGSIGVVHPLPCFGCSWDCFLGHGLCVESIPVEPVVDALFGVLDGQREPPATLALKTLDSQALGLIADASERYRVAQADRALRLGTILQLDHANQSLEAANRSQAAEMERARGAVKAIQVEADARAVVIQEMTTALRESDKRHALLVEDLSSRDAQIDQLRAVAGERLALLEEIHHQAASRARALEEVTAALHERDCKINEAARLEVVNARAAKLHIDEMSAAIEERDRRIAGLEQRLTSRLARFIGERFSGRKK